MKLWLVFVWCLSWRDTLAISEVESPVKINASVQKGADDHMYDEVPEAQVPKSSSHSLTRHSRSVVNIGIQGLKEAIKEANLERIVHESIQQIKPDEKSVYVIPYMRPGRSDNGNNNDFKRDMIPGLRFGRSDGSLIPYLRIGRSFQSKQNDREEDVDNFYLEENTDTVEEDNFQSEGHKRNAGTNERIIPYLRLGRNNNKISLEDVEMQSNHSLIPQIRYGRSADSKPESYLKREFIIPSMRPGRSTTRVQIPLSSSEVIYRDYGSDEVQPNKFRQEAQAVILLLGDKLRSHDPLKAVHGIEEKSPSSFVIPYPRLGKRYLSQLSILKQAIQNKGRNDAYQALKTNDNVQTTSDYVLPYPRPGKKRSVNDGYMLPVLRMGRSSLMIPNMRPGRSSFVIPNMRPGRSNFVIPNMRPGRSSFVIPNMRPGRSNTILPYLRPGRSSDYIFPYLRLGKSGLNDDDTDDSSNHDGNRKSDAELDSEFFVSSLGIDMDGISAKTSIKGEPEFTNPDKKLNKNDLLEDNMYLLPSLRPGRGV